MAETQHIPLARPSIGDAERSAAQRVLSGTQLTNGPELLHFESLLASHSERKFAIATSSGTSALELSLWSLGVGPGDSVIISAFGFPAAANAVAARGALPIAVDVLESSWLMNVAQAREAVRPSTKAIVCIDQLGAVTSSRDIKELEDTSGVPVLSDAACGFGGCDAQGQPGGSAGRMATFSFHPRKLITTGEGGAIVCNDEELSTRLRQLRNHGQVGGGQFASIGTNARLGECSAAIGVAQIDRMPAMQEDRRLLVQGYRERLGSLAHRGLLCWQQLPKGSVHANQSFSVLLHESCNRSRVISWLKERHIESGPATYSFCELGIHKQSPRADAPVARSLHLRALSLPLYIGMRARDLDRVCVALAEVLGDAMDNEATGNEAMP